MLNRSKTWAGLVLIATFASGVVVGGAGAAAWAQYRKPADARRPSYAERMQHDLALTPTQRASMDTVLESYQPRLSAAWQAVQPALAAYRASRDSVFAEVRTHIAAVLTPEQRVKYQTLNAHADSVRRAHETPSNRTHDSAATHAR